jgi:hypothetical protein
VNEQSPLKTPTSGGRYMKKIILGVLATALSTASTVAFSPSAKADSIYDHRPRY